MRGVVLVVIGLSGCLRAPTPLDDGDDAGDHSEGDVATTETGDEIALTAQGGFYRLAFAGKGMPTSLMLGGAEMLTNGQAMCPHEEGTGLAIYPWDTIDNGRPDPTNQATRTFFGPVVAGVELDWRRPLMCDVGDRPLDGRTRFTLFPDGRIHRYDEVNILETDMMPVSGDCRVCGSDPMVGAGTSLYLTSYVTVQASSVVPNILMPGVDVRFDGPICAANGPHAVAFSWRGKNGDPMLTGRQRLIDGGAVQSIVYDWYREDTDLAERMPGDPYSLHTSWVPGAQSACADLNTRATDLSANRPLTVTVGTAAMPLGLGVDGMYQGAAGGPAMSIRQATLSATSTIGPGWAVWLQLEQNGRLDVVHSDPTMTGGDWYFEQRMPPGENGRPSSILWFRDELDPTESISLRTSDP